MMNLPELLLLLVALTTFFNTGLQYYTTVSTYPLLQSLPDAGFVAYHKAYQRTLPWSIYLPYTLLMLSTLALLVVRPEAAALGWVLLLLVLDGSIMAVSLAFAAPVHARLDREGKRPELLSLLRRYNLPRLLAASLSSLLVLALMAQTFSA
jgi:hypothetical protein